MITVGDYFVDDIEVTQGAAVEGNRGPQWKLTIKVPWSDYPDANNWVDRAEGAEAPLGSHHSLFYVNSLKDGKDGSAPWDYQYRMSTLDYDGDESALEDAPRPSGGGPPPMPTERRPQGQRAMQPTSQVVVTSGPRDNLWDRRDISIKWGQAVNLAATAHGVREEMISVERHAARIESFAKELFPLLIKWEKEAVDGYFAKDEPAEGELVSNLVPLTDDESREQELQNTEVPQTQLPRQPVDEPPMPEEEEELPW